MSNIIILIITIAIIGAIVWISKKRLTAFVDYDHFDHHCIPSGRYTHIDLNIIKEAHFPVTCSGTARLEYDYFEGDGKLTIGQMLTEGYLNRKFRFPNLAESEAFQDQNPNERKRSMMISFCGVIRYNRVSYMYADNRGVILALNSLGQIVPKGCRILVVRK